MKASNHFQISRAILTTLAMLAFASCGSSKTHDEDIESPPEEVSAPEAQTDALPPDAPADAPPPLPADAPVANPYAMGDQQPALEQREEAEPPALATKHRKHSKPKRVLSQENTAPAQPAPVTEAPAVAPEPAQTVAAAPPVVETPAAVTPPPVEPPPPPVQPVVQAPAETPEPFYQHKYFIPAVIVGGIALLWLVFRKRG